MDWGLTPYFFRLYSSISLSVTAKVSDIATKHRTVLNVPLETHLSAANRMKKLTPQSRNCPTTSGLARNFFMLNSGSAFGIDDSAGL